MDCLPLLTKCKAECCGSCPVPEATYLANRDKAPRKPVLEFRDSSGNIHAVDARGNCVFKGEDFRCAIYDVRPEVCRAFGNEANLLLTCPWQAADGRKRHRAERRQVERMIDPHRNAVLKYVARQRA